MSKVTITVEQDDGSDTSHSITFPDGADVGDMILAAAIQAGWTPKVLDEKEAEIGNPKTPLRFLAGHTFKGWKNLVNAHRIEKASNTARGQVLASSQELEKSAVVE